ncbi:hypothetical protein [Pelagerythrobacter aerophilus]
MRRPFVWLLLAAALPAACSQEAPEREAVEPQSSPTAGDAGTTAGEATVDPAAEEPADADGYSSAYTAFDLDVCRVTGEASEGASVDYACPGRGDVPIFVHLGDGRLDIDAGVDGEEFMTIGAFNELGERLEWRMKDGAPFAVIFRYRDVAPQSTGRTVIGVEKIGRQGAPGCRVAQIAGDTPGANRVAREIADTRANDFRCGVDEMRVVGNAR